MTAVLVIRRFDSFSRAVAEAGCEVFNLPLIETIETAEALVLAERISLGNYDGVFVTSARAAEILARTDGEIDSFGGVVYVLGRAGHDILGDKTLRLSFCETANTAEEMLAAISSEEIENKRFLFIRGDRSLGAVGDFLKERATLEEIVVYKTETIAVSPAELERLRQREFDLTCFFSPSGVDGFIENFGESLLAAIPTAAIGRTTADYLRSHGSEPQVIAPKSDREAFAAVVIEYLSKV